MGGDLGKMEEKWNVTFKGRGDSAEFLGKSGGKAAGPR